MLTVLYFISVFLAFIYIIIIFHTLTSFNEITEWTTSDDFIPETKISIIVPFRNEEDSLGQCLTSIQRSNYPKNLLEIIAVDDHSTDLSLSEIPENIEVYKSQLPGKKNAIQQGIYIASGTLIITTDADCTYDKDWIRMISSYYEYTKKSMIVGMVSLQGNNNLLECFQIMETCGVMGLHGSGIHNGTHFLANGANLAFEKKLFIDLNPYSDNAGIASGDDVFFINKLAEKDPSKVGFLKAKKTVVETSTEETLIALWNQRKRWATKTKYFSKGVYKWMTGAIWLLSVTILINLLLIPFTKGYSLYILLMQLFVKGSIDYIYLRRMTSYFDKSESLRFFIPSFLMQTIYIFISGLFALFGGKYQWKDRQVQ